MALNDPIADMLTRTRNAIRARHERAVAARSKVCEGIARVLKEEGFVNDYDVIDDGKQGLIRLELKYGPHGEDVIRRIDRVSKPGRRIYRGVDGLPRPLEGLGIGIVSTSSGIVSDRQAREKRVGGEVLCVVE